MAYITPQTNVYLLSGVPLDPDGRHTLLFESRDAQSQYFISKNKYNLDRYSYQRHTTGSIRVGILSDNLYDVNYMMFRNSAYGNKWFYAFVTNVEYVNNNTSIVSYQIDVMQTWLFDYELQECFVERQHEKDDVIGKNILPEPVATGEYVCMGYEKASDDLDPLAIYVMISDENEAPEGTIYDGIYGGVSIFAYNTDHDGITALKTKLDSYAKSPESIVAIYMAPALCAGGTSIATNGEKITYQAKAESRELSFHIVGVSDTIDGYEPKNLKMYTYPYNFLNVYAGTSSATYRYEFFKNRMPQFKIDIPLTMPVQIALRPINYKNVAGRYNSESIVLSGYPQCSWNTDAFKAWLAQNTAPIVENLTKLGVGAISMAATGGAVGGNLLGTAVGGVAELINQGYQASISADITKGSISNGNIDVASGQKNFFVSRMCVNAQYAKMIDDFFTMFGYAQNKIMIPDRSARSHYTYIKTAGCELYGSIPNSDANAIRNIFDRGVTFWKNPDEIGDYSVDNRH